MERQLFSLLFVMMTGVSINSAAQEFSVRGGLSGYWFNEDNPQQAVQIEVIDPRRTAVTWITYDSLGEPVWLAGFGNVRGNTIAVTLNSFRGGRFPTAPDAGEVNVAPWGTAEIEFTD